MTEAQRESMPYDVVVVGAGPAGLAAAIRLKQVSPDLSVVVVEKGAEVGAHILSGAVIDPKGLDELLPDWRSQGAPLTTPVKIDRMLVLGAAGELDISWLPKPKAIGSHGCYIGSLANLCRWLATQAEGLGVDVFPGMAASEALFDEAGALRGVVVGVVGIGKDGKPRPDYQPGVELTGKYVLIAEGARGSLAEQLIDRFGLRAGKQVPKFGLGIKEIWEVPPQTYRDGLVQHSFGYPLDNRTGGGGFVYHFDQKYVAVGLVTHLDYANPFLSPFDEFQRFKLHPTTSAHLKGGRRIAYGARVITEGGYQSIPSLAFPGGALIGCSAGFVNVPRIKGSHNAIKTGMLAAEAVAGAIGQGRAQDVVSEYQAAFDSSWVAKELYKVRNAKPLWARLGTRLGVLAMGVELFVADLLGGFSPLGTLGHSKTDAAATGLARDHVAPVYPRPDGVLTFDKLSSVFLSGVHHEEDQPAHLRLKDPSVPIAVNLPLYGEPARLYCPAAVYEVVYDAAGANPRFQINAANCVHCKTCDIKDPSRNIVWTTPEGGGGPGYPNM